MPTRHKRSRPISRRARRACAMFGVRPEVVAQMRVPDAHAAAAQIDRQLAPGACALVTGPSGSGKSTILRLLAARLRARGRLVVEPPRTLPDRCVVDQFPLDLARTLALLARAGLAEAGVLARRPRELSDGQRWRLCLALAMARACGGGSRREGGATLLIDEFASGLDRLTARCVARTLGRWARGAGVRVVCATARDDLADCLAPELLVRQPLGAPHEVRLGRAP